MASVGRVEMQRSMADINSSAQQGLRKRTEAQQQQAARMHLAHIKLQSWRRADFSFNDTFGVQADDWNCLKLSSEMRSRSMHKWMSDEMERLSSKLARYKPTGSGYNRIQPVLLSRSVTQMLNNPLPAEDQIRGNVSQQERPRSKGVLSRSESEWEEVYPTVQFGQTDNRDKETTHTAERKFAYYRNCSTRIT